MAAAAAAAATLTEHAGDVFTASCALMHCVSRDFAMGRGVAVEFKRRDATFITIGVIFGVTCGAIVITTVCMIVYTYFQEWRKTRGQRAQASVAPVAVHYLTAVIDTRSVTPVPDLPSAPPAYSFAAAGDA